MNPVFTFVFVSYTKWLKTEFSPTFYQTLHPQLCLFYICILRYLLEIIWNKIKTCFKYISTKNLPVKLQVFSDFYIFLIPFLFVFIEI